MALPAFLAEVETYEFREKIRYGVTSGFAAVAILFSLALAFDFAGYLPNARALYLLAPVKVLTNTLQWLALRNRGPVLFAAAANVYADVLLITAIIYNTGGPSSSLMPVYLVVVALIATISNTGITIAVAASMGASYAAMSLMLKLGALEYHPDIVETMLGSTRGQFTWDFVVLDIMRVATFLIVLTFAMAGVLRLVHQKEAELKTANRQLREASRLKDEFLANVTHEFRTPIHGILGLVETLRDGVYGELVGNQERAIDGIDRSAANLLAMVDDLLELERASSHEIAIRRTNLNLSEAVMSAREAAEWMRGKKRLSIESEVADDDWYVVADRKLVDHVLKNLMSNAVKFTPEGGHVKISASHEGNEVLFVVEDDGVGIPPESQEVIFEPFRQVDGSSERAHGGSGLGLAVAKKMVAALGGELDLESHGGKGTRFEVRLPAVLPRDG